MLAKQKAQSRRVLQLRLRSVNSTDLFLSGSPEARRPANLINPTARDQ